jgi:hypothetical protein
LQEKPGHRLLEAVVRCQKDLSASLARLSLAEKFYREDSLANKGQPKIAQGHASQFSPEESEKSGSKLFVHIEKLIEAITKVKAYAGKTEASFAGRFVTPALAENPGRRPRDYLKTAIDCYLFRHGWMAAEIYKLYHPGKAFTKAQCSSIYSAVERAHTSGRPPLIGGWPAVRKREPRKKRVK